MPAVPELFAAPPEPPSPAVPLCSAPPSLPGTAPLPDSIVVAVAEEVAKLEPPPPPPPPALPVSEPLPPPPP